MEALDWAGVVLAVFGFVMTLFGCLASLAEPSFQNLLMFPVGMLMIIVGLSISKVAENKKEEGKEKEKKELRSLHCLRS